jgi:tRNA (guanine-N7-)-methyltransferase
MVGTISRMTQEFPAPTSPSMISARDVRSYVRRGGRLGPQLAAALRSDVPALAPRATTWGLDEFPGCSAWAVEIGSGMGEATLGMARQEPHVGIIAVEVHDRGIAALARGVRAEGLSNVRIHVGDAVNALHERVALHSVDEIRMWFPDPWPKKRHHKRRLITPDFVEMATARLIPGGRLHIATDHPEYADHIAAVLASQRMLDAELVRNPRPDWRPVTKFESTGIEAGRVAHDFIYRRH